MTLAKRIEMWPSRCTTVCHVTQLTITCKLEGYISVDHKSSLDVESTLGRGIQAFEVSCDGDWSGLASLLEGNCAGHFRVTCKDNYSLQQIIRYENKQQYALSLPCGLLVRLPRKVRQTMCKRRTVARQRLYQRR